MKKLSEFYNEKQTDDFIIENNGCSLLDCSYCYYVDKEHICPPNLPHKTFNYGKFIYEHVLNKKKVKKLKEILS